LSLAPFKSLWKSTINSWVVECGLPDLAIIEGAPVSCQELTFENVQKKAYSSNSRGEMSYRVIATANIGWSLNILLL
jgi:hypothetical protein